MTSNVHACSGQQLPVNSFRNSISQPRSPIMTPTKFLARHVAHRPPVSHVMTPYTHLTIQKIDTYNAVGFRADV